MTTAYFDDVPYQGPVIVKTLKSGAYQWKIDNKTFIFSDYTSITEDDIPNPYYRLGIVDAINNDTAIMEPLPEERSVLQTYRIWNHVPPDQIPAGNRSSIPYSINYNGIGLTRRLHPRVWKLHGLVVQIVYYENYDALNTTFSVPVVRERWHWTLDSDTNFAIARTIHIEWFADQDDLTDPENPVSQILPPKKEYIKHYDSTTSRVNEIQRRRSNVVTKLEEDVIGLIAMTESISIKDAITIGQAFMTYVTLLKQDFIDHGDDDLANKTIDPVTAVDHTFLSNDLAAVGNPGVTIAQYVYAELVVDISDMIDAFDFSSLPEY